MTSTSTPARDPALPRPADGIALPRVPQQARSRRKQEQLLDAAERLFAERGYDHVTADDIGAEAGLPVGTFYNYFASKPQVLVMIVDRHEPAVLPTLQPIVDAFEAGEDIGGAVEEAVRSIAEGKAAMPWLRRTWLRLVHASEEVAAYQHARDAAWESHIAALLSEATRQGRIPPRHSASTALVVRTTVEAATDEVVLHGRGELDEVVATCARMVTDAVTGTVAPR